MDVKLAKGDIAHIDYDLWVVGPGDQRTLHETTRVEVAKEHDTYDEKKPYGPIPVAVGLERVPKGLDEALMGLEVGASKDVTIPPDKGAGARDPKLVKLFPMREFLKKDIEPEVGLEVTIDGRKGTINAVTAGRVRVDFNNPLAGRTLEYKVTVTARTEKPEEKVRDVLEMDYGLGEQFKIFVKAEDEVDVFLPDLCRTDERWFVSKFRVVADLREIAGYSKVRFVEEYERPKAPAPPEEKAKEEAPEPDETTEEEPPAPPEEEAKPEAPKKKGKGRAKKAVKKEPPKKSEPEPEPPRREKQPEEL